MDWRRARSYKEREAVNDPRPGRLERRADRYLEAVAKREAQAKAKKRVHGRDMAFLRCGGSSRHRRHDNENRRDAPEAPQARG